MVTFLIVVAEVCFWIFIIAGLVTRYILKKEKVSMLLLGATPLIDLTLLVFTVIDLKSGEEATFVHALAAVYIGVSIVYGKQIIKWADFKFQYYFLKTGNQPVKLSGMERRKKEITGFLKHLTAYIIGAAILLGMNYFLQNFADTENLTAAFRIWSIILGIDFLISSSYVLFPNVKKDKT